MGLVSWFGVNNPKKLADKVISIARLVQKHERPCIGVVSLSPEARYEMPDSYEMQIQKFVSKRNRQDANLWELDFHPDVLKNAC